MNGLDALLEERLARFVEHHARNGERLAPEALCADRPELIEPLRAAIARYLELDRTLDLGAGPDVAAALASPPEAYGSLPQFDGFQTIERLGQGGTGSVYKVRDLQLGRTVAAKVIRADAAIRTSLADFLREARALALFQDPRIVQIHEFRAESDPPVLIMEHVEGFELGRLARSLEVSQRARILIDVCEALERAHALGLQHRDLKPSNILLGASLTPKIADFGLASGDPGRGHLKGTLAYLAPEQLDPAQAIDARADLYALGVILYELLCGTVPYPETSLDALRAAQARGDLRLPVEIDPTAPEPLQAIALKAMELRAEDRYASAREMAADLKRYLEGRPVVARPSHYGTALSRRLRPHLSQVEEWLRLRLVYPHEAARIRAAYRPLEAREDDWIVESRTLSYSQIALYLGAFLLLAGGLLYFGVHRFFGGVEGIGGPLLVLGVPFVALTAAGHLLYRREQKAVAVAFALAAVALLPILLLILFHEAGFARIAAETAGQLFQDGSVSNRQLQVAALLALAWAAALAWTTRTVGLSSVAVVLGLVTLLAVCADLGLRDWIEEGRWDRLALHLVPLLLLYAAAGLGFERSGKAWFSRPLYVGAAVLMVAVLELLALDGRLFSYLGISMARFQPAEIDDPLLLDTLTAMSLNGVLLYAIAWAVERRGTELMRTGAWLLFVVSPFAALEPLAYLNEGGRFDEAFLWLYLGLGFGVTFLSHQRQRRAFYAAGLLNIGAALWLISDRFEWFDEPSWPIAVIATGIAICAAGFLIDRRERMRRRVGGESESGRRSAGRPSRRDGGREER